MADFKPGIVHDGNYLITWVDAIADMTAPTQSELSGGHDVTCQLTPDGLSREASDEAVDTSRLCSTFTTQQVGRTSFDLGLTFVRIDEDPGATPPVTDWAYDNLVKEKRGYIAIRDNQDGDNPWALGDHCEVYHVVCGTRSKASPAANELQTFTVPLFMLAEPALYATVA